MNLYAEVALPLPLDRTFTYSVPPEQAERLSAGMRVLVPFGERVLTAFVVGTGKRKPDEGLKLKPIGEILDEAPVFSSSFLIFTKKLSRYFFSPWGEILQAAVPPSYILRGRTSISLTPKGRDALDQDLLSKDEKEVAVWLSEKPHALRFLQEKTRLKNPASLISRLEKKGLVLIQKEIKRVKRSRKVELEAGPTQLELDFTFDENLRLAAQSVAESLRRKAFSPFVLHGPRLRREAVYLDLVKSVLKAGGRVLYLVPEISLTPDLLEKFEKRMGEEVAALHSGLTEKRRELEWQKIKDGRGKVIVGPRSALLAPVEDLRLIIVDEEQDESYSQQENSRYDIRTGAWLRAQQEKSSLVYGSATPTLGAYYKAKKGRYLIDLGSRTGKGRVTVVDSRQDLGLISRSLQVKLKERIEKNEPVLLFFNRRGYASYLQCARCGFVPKCARCDLSLSFHKREGKLVCPYCRYSVPLLEACPRCQSRLIGKKGVGIEAVAEELKRMFPQRRIEIFTADAAGRKAEKAEIMRRFAGGDIDVLVGTHFLVHQADFPPVSFMAILYPEMLLNLADFRSGEKAFQSISRSLDFLRDDSNAEALIQTEAPGHYSIREAARGDYRAFYDQEIKFRRLMEYPPFSPLAQVFFIGENLRRVAKVSREFADRVSTSGAEVKIFGPGLAAVAKIRDLHRVQVSLKARKRSTLDKVLALALEGIKLKKTVFLFD